MKQDSAAPDQTKDVAVRLQLLATRALRIARSHHSKSGVGSAQYSALAALYDRGPISVVELARVERVAHPTMSRIVSGLEKMGAVERHADTADRRQRQLLLTPSGRALYEEICANRAVVIRAVLTRLSPAMVTELLGAVTAAVAALDPPDTSD